MSAVPKPAIELRAMTDADLAAVMKIETGIYAFPWTQGNFCDALAAGYGCWMLELDREPIGYAVLMHALDEAHLLNLSIAAGSQRRGYGSMLLQRICELARGKGARLLFLEVRPSNVDAQRLYARHGFEQVGLRRDYYPAHAGREDALVMSLPL